MNKMIDRAGLQIAVSLVQFIENDVLPPLALNPEKWWEGFARIFRQFSQENADLLLTRDRLQAKIDGWYASNRDRPAEPVAYRNFLTEIGYVEAEPAPFVITTTNVDEEVAVMAGPQLVVPILNARFALNAANARWGSLYDALYGTDALNAPVSPARYDEERGAAVVAHAKAFLDSAVPLATGSWAMFAGGVPALHDMRQLVGYNGRSILLINNGLHIELVIDPSHHIGLTDPAGIADILLESALTTIVDFEDSVATVDAEDKVAAYTNWLGLMRGDLVESFTKNGVETKRCLNVDRHYTAVDGKPLILSGRSVLFVRNVGHLMRTPTVLIDGQEAPEGILDAIMTSTIGLYDLDGHSPFRNSRAGSIYIVKPKMHGPGEAEFANRVFDAVEDFLGLTRNAIKIGVMDEERRTSANLAATIYAVRHRIAFINTGFLDRTGDEIHTGMHAGAMVPKGEMKSVRIGLACGFCGKAQIGKGMWAAPDRMADMLEQKVMHPLSGANTAWVPSPTAATLHSMHYHQVNVFARQAEIATENMPSIDQLLIVPIAFGRNWSRDEVARELDNNAQGILGYVVRWIDQGIGCSKVPDIEDIGLMEDRATLRISSQHIANWLLHGVVTVAQVDAAFERMALKVDAQNLLDPAYKPLCWDSLALQAAKALVYNGVTQPNGYTEPQLNKFRAKAKTFQASQRERESSPNAP
jgi:malate synthase